jgi:sphinganine-1-phosphate aldolase
VPSFDFAVPGVRSISADLHKYGLTPKGASTVLFSSAEARDYHVFEFDDWPAGYYRSATITGTRPAGAVAAAWAVMHHLGEDGYLRVAEQILAAKRAVLDVLAEQGLRVFGRDPAAGSRPQALYADEMF